MARRWRRVGLAPPWTIRILQPPAVVAGLLAAWGRMPPGRAAHRVMDRVPALEQCSTLVPLSTAGDMASRQGGITPSWLVRGRVGVSSSPGAADGGRRCGCVGKVHAHTDICWQSSGEVPRDPLSKANLVRAALARRSRHSRRVARHRQAARAFRSSADSPGVYRTTFGCRWSPWAVPTCLRSRAYRIGIARGPYLV